MHDDQGAEQQRILSKIRKCLAVAADDRGEESIRETAWRQAQALMKKHGFHPDKQPAEEGPPDPASGASGTYWAGRSAADAARARLATMVLCRDGWYVPE